MSAPIDVPQNININVPHTDRVVEPPETDTSNTASDQSSIENKNREREEKNLHQRKKKKEPQDTFERQSGEVEPEEDIIIETENDEKKSPEIGKNVDFSA